MPMAGTFDIGVTLKKVKEGSTLRFRYGSVTAERR